MPNKKGSRVAASQARAKAAARKKTRSAGPDLSGATKQVETPETPEMEPSGEQRATAVAVAEQPAAQPARAATQSPYRRVATRRERQSLAVVSSANLRWELLLITAVTGTSGIILILLKFFTHIGR